MIIPNTLPELQAIRMEVEGRIAALIGSSGAIVAYAKGKKPKASKEPKAKRETGPSAWGDWSKKVWAEQKSEIEVYKGSIDVKQGAHLKWLAIGKDGEKGGPGSERFGKESSAWLDFKAEWDVAHPKDQKVSAPATVGSDTTDGEGEVTKEAPKKRRGPKKISEMTPEELETRAIKKALKGAKKSKEEEEGRAEIPVGNPLTPTLAPHIGGGGSTTPVVAASEVVEEEEEVELIVYIIDGTRYVRPGNKAEDGTITWATGDLWFFKKTAVLNKGDYVGCVDEHGIIDSNAEEPPL